MTKTRSIQQPPSKKLREGRNSKSSKNATAQSPDACELIIDELRSRRERLQQCWYDLRRSGLRMPPACRCARATSASPRRTGCLISVCATSRQRLPFPLPAFFARSGWPPLAL